MKTVFLRVLESDDKATALLMAIRNSNPANGPLRFDVDPRSFASVPRSPFAYWVSEKILRLFASTEPRTHHTRLVVSTNPLNDDFRYVRSWWEAAPNLIRRTWMPWAKGGSYSPIYYDIDTTIRWDGARVTYAGFLGTENRPLERPASVQHFFRPGLTWPRRTNGLSFRTMPMGCIFADKGPAMFVEDDEIGELLSLASITNSRAFGLLVSLQLARTQLAQSYEVGLIQTTPVPSLTDSDREALARLARQGWSMKRSLDTGSGTSHAFALPALLQVSGDTLAARAAAWNERSRVVEDGLAAIQAEIDDRCFALYGIDDEDRRVITEGFGVGAGGSERSEVNLDEDDEDEAETGAGLETLAAELVSWAVGVAFGRFDIRLATDDGPLPAEPEPFDPLPVCSPGMLIGDDGLPPSRPPAGYPLSFPDDGILVDDSGHSRDLTAGVRAVFEAVFASGADAVWQESSALLDPRDHDLRRWLASGFFDHHLQRHSKSRRKAPVLWQLGISGRYSVWCYAHRMTRDSLFAIQNDVVAPKLAHEERRLSSLAPQAGGTPSARERAEVAAQESVVDELRTLVEEVHRIAPLWNPDLDDGIVLVMAPLWRLVPTHKAWQRELRAKWDELVAGKYDWAHIAMHLWPERVIPKSAADRSLAIAHGLEEVFWAEGPDGKWTRRQSPTRSIDDLVAERTSPAVKAALTSLLEAAGPVGDGGRRGRKSGVTA